MKRVEQLSENNKIILDYDKTLTTKEIKNELLEIFEFVENENSIFKIKSNNLEFTLLIKNITYLGNPHPLYTKRIQLSPNWEERLKEKNCFICGIYSYNSKKIFVFFDKKNYMNRKLNNSSAHVWTNDLVKGLDEGIFQKVDIQNNNIFVVREDKFNYFIKNWIEKKNYNTNEIELFENFKKSLSNRWYGMESYNEMISSNYHNKFQTEWGGFYFEFKFENYLNDNLEYNKICEFIKNKKKYSIDLDVKFKSGFYGDLKTHSDKSSAILGNDQETIFKILKEDKKFWYIVLNHSPIMDSLYEYEVTKFWNLKQGKKDLMSYSSKMKHTLILKKLEILEINDYNKKYLDEFKQGKNSNGNSRNSKVKINSKLIHNFRIYESQI